MTEKSKEKLTSAETITDVIDGTKKSLSILEKETWINFFKKAGDWFKKLFGIKSDDEAHIGENDKDSIGENDKDSIGENNENIQEGGDKVSEGMFQQLLKMEGSQNFVAKSHKQNFGETFVTGPYGMVYKHIDKQGNLLNSPIPFKEGEVLTKERSENNAKAYYNKTAKKRKESLDGKGFKYNQDMLDALVSASGGTTAATNRLKNFVLSHRDNKKEIYNFMSNFATKAAGNGKVMPGLVYRRKFEANRFRGNKHPFSDYQKGLYA